MKHRILIVEDNILLAGQQKKWFEKSGYEAVTTIDEPGARRLLKKEPFDLVLSDVRFPQGDGISLLEWMQRERIDVPFIIMTDMLPCRMPSVPSRWEQKTIWPSLFRWMNCKV